jgi:hypothetical protein
MPIGVEVYYKFIELLYGVSCLISVIVSFITCASLVIARVPLDAQAALSESGKTSWKFDFGSGNVESGYTQILPTAVCSNGLGYRFEPGAAILSVDRNTDDALRSDFCISESPFSVHLMFRKEIIR